jgi:PAS domain S-box-containing protein
MAMDSFVDLDAAERSVKLMRLAGLNTFIVDGDTVTASAEICRALGLPEDQPVNREAFCAYVHPDDDGRVRETSQRLRREGGSATLEFRVRGVAGWRWVRTTVLAETQSDGRVRIHGLEQDVTELVEAREAALSAEAATETKSRFLASMSHEIRTPMNGVLGVLHLLRAERLSESGRALLDEALQCGHMLSELINDILDLSKIEAGQMQLSPEPTDPAAALRGVANLLRPQAEAKGLTLTIEAEDEGWFNLDPVRLRQALFNLMGNAVKFTHQGRVTARMGVRGADGKRRVRFEIEDTGVGVPDEARPRLFGRFQQADDSATREFGGTGLGLAITRHLAHMMGGDVGYDSVEGQGSTFWIEVVAPQAVRPMPVIPTDGDRLEGLKILVVEDNPANRLIVRKILEGLGSSVELAEDGAAGVEAAGRIAPSVILMDVQMPGMDGLEATRRIRSLPGPAARAPIIALTANVLEHQRQTYLTCGMDGVVGKPIAPAALLTEILRLIRRPSTADVARSRPVRRAPRPNSRAG